MAAGWFDLTWAAKKMVKKASLDKADRADKIGTGDKTPIESIKESEEPIVELGETKC